jgi:hypothetical protein
MSDADDELLERAEKLKTLSGAAKKSAKRRRKDSSAEKAREHIEDIQETYQQTTAGLSWFYNKIFLPVSRHPWWGALFRTYGRLWKSAVYIDPDGDGEEDFSKKRALMMIVATGLFLYMLPALLYGTLEFMTDSIRMLTTYKKDEIWYLGKSQEIDPEGNVFTAQGCATIECSDQTSIYFRIKPSLAHHLWSLWHNGNIFFPDFVAAGIQNDINKCTVTRYGLRWKFLVRNWDVYPQILSVTCIPVTEDEIRTAPQENRL